MKCQFSETQFAFGIMSELVKKRGPNKGWKAPYFPTQVKEAEDGYDVKIRGPIRTIFLQFKIPDKKIKSNAKHWADFNTSYYEFKLRKEHGYSQHNKLIELTQKDKRFSVYYCAPCFSTFNEYELHYNAQTIQANSMFIDCRSLRVINDNETHSICYTQKPYKGMMYSEPTYCEMRNIESIIMGGETFQNTEAFISACTKLFNINLSGTEGNFERITRISNYFKVKMNLQVGIYEINDMLKERCVTKHSGLDN